MFCCSVALFNCGGTEWYCNRCHNEGGKKIRDCNGKKCPLNVPHPPAGPNYKKSGFALGCSICRSDRLSEYDEAKAAVRKEKIHFKSVVVANKGEDIKANKAAEPPAAKQVAARPAAKQAAARPAVRQVAARPAARQVVERPAAIKKQKVPLKAPIAPLKAKNTVLKK